MSDRAPAANSDAAASRPARLCMVVHNHYPPDPRVEREAKAALQAGYEVDVVCLRGPGQRKCEVIAGINVHRIEIRRNRGAGLLRMLVEYLGFALRASILTLRVCGRSRGAEERIVQIHAPPDFLIIAGVVPKLLGSRLVLDIHDLSSHLYRARFARQTKLYGVLNLLLALAERAACRIADQVITVHEPYRTELISHGVSGSEITVVMNAVDEGLVEHALANRAGNGSTRRTGPFTIAYHGTITPAYGVDLLVEALPRVLEQVPEVRCLILGDGDALPSIRERAASLGVADMIEFSGRFEPIDAVLTRVASAGCGVIPNRPLEYNRFCLSGKLFEYVALGVPAVVARLETLARHFSSDEVTFFDAGDPDSLAESIAWVALNPAAAEARAARALARSRSYAWSEQRAHYLGVLAAPHTGAQAAQRRLLARAS